MPKYACELKPEQYTLLDTKTFPEPTDGIYYWHVANFAARMDKYKVLLALEKMMSIWQHALDITEPVDVRFKLESTTDISKAHFIFSFGPFDHDIITVNGHEPCPWPFDGDQGVLAHAYSLTDNEPYLGQVHMDDSEKWDDMHGFEGAQLHVHLLTVALHEMGHAWGIGHSEKKTAVMAAMYDGIKTELTQDDLSAFAKKLSIVKSKYKKEVPKVNKQPKGLRGLIIALLERLLLFFS